MLMGSNKSLLRARWNPNADDVKGWANFMVGGDKVEHVGGLGRARIGTERAKFSYVHSSATDGKYVYLATVPDNKNKSKFVVSKAMMADWTLSAEFEPAADLKAKRTLGELYVTGMVYEDGKLYAVSKNHNVLVVIDIAKEAVVEAWGLPSDLTDIRGLLRRATPSKWWITTASDPHDAVIDRTLRHLKQAAGKLSLLGKWAFVCCGIRKAHLPM